MSRVALIGASPRLAEEILAVLLARGFDGGDVRLFGVGEQVGETVEVGNAIFRISSVEPGGLTGFDALMVCGDPEHASSIVPSVARSSTVVIDATAFSRGRKGSALIVPEVNGDLIASLAPGTVIAAPTPASVGLAAALAPLHEAAGVERVVATVFEPASADGDDGVAALGRQALLLLQGQSLDREEDPQLLAFNPRPRAPSGDLGQAAVEQSIADEIAALFGDPRIDVLATAIRVPVFFGTALSVYVETERALEAGEAETLFLGGRGLLVAGSVPVEPNQEDDDLYRVVADPCPGPVDVASSDAVHVARIRTDPRAPKRHAFWICFDDQRKGIALNLVSTLEIALRDLRGR